MKLTLVFAAAMLALSGCVMDEIASDIEAFSKPLHVETGNPSEHEGCEIKGSGAYNPCTTGKSYTAAVQPMAPPTRAQCVDGSSDRQDAELDRKLKTIPDYFTTWSEEQDRLVENIVKEMDGECAALGYPTESEPIAPPPEISSPEPVFSSAGDQICKNEFGGRDAVNNEWICDNRHYYLFCECPDGACELIRSGMVGCTVPGYVGKTR